MQNNQWEEIKNFTKEEFQCSCGCGQEDMNFKFIKRIDEAREVANLPFNINSGYRCESYNKEILGSKKSSHMANLAVDISCNDSRSRFKIIDALMEVNLTRIGVADTFIHVDADNNKLQDLVWVY